MIEPTAAIEQLTNHQQQADMDGCFVTVSRQALEEVLDYLRTPPASQSDEALVEIARIVRDRLEDGGGCVDGPDWDWDVDECAKVADDVARAILPIITAREASAREEGIRLGIEAAAKATVIEADRSSPFGDKRFILQNITTVIRAIDPATVGEGK